MTVDGVQFTYHNGYAVQPLQSPYVDGPVWIGGDGSGQSGAVPADDTSAESRPAFSAENPAGRIADLEQVSLKFNREERFDYIGSESRIDDLDMQKAISDMQKDRVLQNYQYFVGSAGTPAEDGTVALRP